MTTDRHSARLSPLRWYHPAPAALGRLLESLGCVVAGPDDRPARTFVDLGGFHAELVAVGGRGDERLEFGDAPVEWPPGQRRPTSRLVAIGVATIDTGRWLGDGPVASSRHGVADDTLGARGFAIGAGLPQVLVLEPARDGRLAAALARFGEGPVAIYLATSTSTAIHGSALSRPWAGARLLPPRRPWGPFLLVVDA